MTTSKLGKMAVVAGFVFAASVSAASAATFNFQASGSNVGSIVTSDDGIGLTVTPENSFFGSGNEITRNGVYGIGVLNAGESSIPSYPVDGNGTTDSLLFTFDTEVTLDSVSVTNGNYANGNTNYSNASSFDILVDGLLAISNIPLVDGSPLIAQIFGAPLAGLMGTTFEFIANNGGEAFKIREVNVSVAAIPVPAALPLLGAGLLGLGLLGRRRKTAASA